MIELNVRPPYSIALICAEECVPPKALGGAPVAWTGTCVASGIRSDADGSTRITLSTQPGAFQSDPRAKLFPAVTASTTSNAPAQPRPARLIRRCHARERASIDATHILLFHSGKKQWNVSRVAVAVHTQRIWLTLT